MSSAWCGRPDVVIECRRAPGRRNDRDLAGEDGAAGLAGAPAVLGQLLDAHERGDGLVVVEAIARRRALWADHAVAALPRPDEGNADARADRGLFDAVHALWSISRGSGGHKPAHSPDKHLTKHGQTLYASRQQVRQTFNTNAERGERHDRPVVSPGTHAEGRRSPPAHPRRRASSSIPDSLRLHERNENHDANDEALPPRRGGRPRRPDGATGRRRRPGRDDRRDGQGPRRALQPGRARGRRLRQRWRHPRPRSPFGVLSEYLEVPAGDVHHRRSWPRAPTLPTAPSSVRVDLDFAAGTMTTVAATNVLASIEAQVLSDDPAPAGWHRAGARRPLQR